MSPSSEPVHRTWHSGPRRISGHIILLIYVKGYDTLLWANSKVTQPSWARSRINTPRLNQFKGHGTYLWTNSKVTQPSWARSKVTALLWARSRPHCSSSPHSPGHPLHPPDRDPHDLTSVAVSVSRCLEHSKRAQGEITGPVSQRFAGVPSIQMRWRFNNACASGMPGCYQCFMYRWNAFFTSTVAFSSKFAASLVL